MDRQPPRVTTNAVDLYVTTYYSLLRSSGDVWVRAFEEAHIYSGSSLHQGAAEDKPDVAAFAYSAARLPGCMLMVERLIAGQSIEQFTSFGFDVREWTSAVSRGRRRPNLWDGRDTLAVFVTSASDIDDLVPIVTAYQIEWNKMHNRLTQSRSIEALDWASLSDADLADQVGSRLDIGAGEVAMLFSALEDPRQGMAAIASRERDLSLRLLAGSLLEYRRAGQRWWQHIDEAFRPGGEAPRPVYFVSSNTHALVNLIGGYARTHQAAIIDFAQQCNPEGLADAVMTAMSRGDESELADLCHYLLRRYIRADPQLEARRRAAVQAFDAEVGIATVNSPGRLEVNAQLFELRRFRRERLDPRVVPDNIELLAESDAVIINIDYPLGMAAYHHLTQLAQGVSEIRGVYVMGKAATLNGRVGDVMISTVAYDEHSENTYLFRNGFSAADVRPYVHSTVLDNQKALTVRGSFLQSRDTMHPFYRSGYTVLEMEAGPYLSAIYEMVYPKRHPRDEIVHLSNQLPFDFGLLHYASDTPYSRRQSLLSKSLSYFGVDSTYGCAIAIVRRVLEQEIARIAGRC